MRIKNLFCLAQNLGCLCYTQSQSQQFLAVCSMPGSEVFSVNSLSLHTGEYPFSRHWCSGLFKSARLTGEGQDDSPSGQSLPGSHQEWSSTSLHSSLPPPLWTRNEDSCLVTAQPRPHPVQTPPPPVCLGNSCLLKAIRKLASFC